VGDNGQSAPSASAHHPHASPDKYARDSRSLLRQRGALKGEIHGPRPKPPAIIAHFEYRRSAASGSPPATSSDCLTDMNGTHVAGDDGDAHPREKARPQVSLALIGIYECTTTERSAGPPIKPNTRACMSSKYDRSNCYGVEQSRVSCRLARQLVR
jgi:hypothetical protein